MSSAQLVIGQSLVLPGELKDVQETAAAVFNAKLKSPEPPPPPTPTCQPRSYANMATSKPQVPVHFQCGQYVYVRRGGCIPPLAPIYLGPY